jgi:hypothetical protein
VTPATDALTDLQAALDALIAALVSGEPDAVLAAEPPLSMAVSRLDALKPDELLALPDMRTRLHDILFTIARGRRLGAASAELLARFAPPAYGRSGAVSAVRAAAGERG